MPTEYGEYVFKGNFYVRYAALTDTGCVRSHNEDNYGIFVDNHLFCLADGVGGLDAGEIASEELIASISTSLGRYKQGKNSFKKKLVSLFQRAYPVNINTKQLLEDANSDVYKRAQLLQKRMASTVVLFQIDEGECTVAHVGDSRAYLLRNRILGQLTNDHTLSMELMLAGAYVEINNQSMLRHSITKAVGSHPKVSPDEVKWQWTRNDMFLLCSDGLTDMINDEKIQEIMISFFPVMEKVVHELVDAAKIAGGRDNITVIVGYIGEI